MRVEAGGHVAFCVRGEGHLLGIGRSPNLSRQRARRGIPVRAFSYVSRGLLEFSVTSLAES